VASRDDSSRNSSYWGMCRRGNIRDNNVHGLYTELLYDGSLKLSYVFRELHSLEQDNRFTALHNGEHSHTKAIRTTNKSKN